MNLPEPSSVRRAGVSGAGTIGASWAAYFLARGMDVQAWDPAPGAERALRGSWPAHGRRSTGSARSPDGASPDRLSFHAGPAAAVARALGGRELASIAGERDTLLLPVLSTLARLRREHGFS